MAQKKNSLTEFLTTVSAIFGIIGGIAAVLVVPEFRQLAGLEPSKSSEIASPTPALVEVISTPRLNHLEFTPTMVITPIFSETPARTLGNWILTVGKYTSVELAKYDATNYTSKGFHVEIFCRVSEVTPGGSVEIRAAVVGFETEESVNSAAPDVMTINPYAQIKPLDLWCPNLVQSEDYISCNYNTCQ